MKPAPWFGAGAESKYAHLKYFSFKTVIIMKELELSGPVMSLATEVLFSREMKAGKYGRALERQKESLVLEYRKRHRVILYFHSHS